MMRNGFKIGLLVLLTAALAGFGWATRERVIYCKWIDVGEHHAQLCITHNRWSGRLHEKAYRHLGADRGGEDFTRTWNEGRRAGN